MQMISDLFIEFLDYKKSYCEYDTILNYQGNIKRFLEYSDLLDKPVKALKKDMIIKYITYLRTLNISNVSIRTYIRDIKVFCMWLYYEGYIDFDVKRIRCPKPNNMIIKPLSANEVKTIDNSFDFITYQGLRNYLVFHLMLDCGLRLNEVYNLKAADISKDYISLHDCKNNKSRFVPLPYKLYICIIDLRILNEISLPPALQKTGYLFFNTTYTSRFQKSSIKTMFYRLKKESGIERLHAHLLRHTFATAYITQYHDIERLRVLLGHQDYNVTKSYLHISTQLDIIHYDLYKLDSIYNKYYKERMF